MGHMVRGAVRRGGGGGRLYRGGYCAWFVMEGDSVDQTMRYIAGGGWSREREQIVGREVESDGRAVTTVVTGL